MAFHSQGGFSFLFPRPSVWSTRLPPRNHRFCFLSVSSAVSYAIRNKDEGVERKLGEGDAPSPVVNSEEADPPDSHRSATKRGLSCLGWGHLCRCGSVIICDWMWSSELTRREDKLVFQLPFIQRWRHDCFYQKSMSTASKYRTWQGKGVLMEIQNNFLSFQGGRKSFTGLACFFVCSPDVLKIIDAKY